MQAPTYQKAFQRYLRYGISIELQLKANEPVTTHYIWRTQGDDKVRPEHAAREGQIFSYADSAIRPPPSDHGCRCRAVPYYGTFDPIYDPPIEPVYPELLILPFLRVGRLLLAWRVWALNSSVSKEWKLGAYKSSKRWANQLEEGGWTPEKITETIKNGVPFSAKNRINNPNTPATRYQLGDEFVVIDDVSKEVIQVSRPRPGGFKPNSF